MHEMDCSLNVSDKNLTIEERDKNGSLRTLERTQTNKKAK